MQFALTKYNLSSGHVSIVEILLIDSTSTHAEILCIRPIAYPNLKNRLSLWCRTTTMANDISTPTIREIVKDKRQEGEMCFM